MRRGEQATVATPGDNHKQVIAGSLHWRTGRLIDTWGATGWGGPPGCSVAILYDRRRVFRQYRVIHVIWDNAGTHKPEPGGTGVSRHRLECHRECRRTRTP